MPSFIKNIIRLIAMRTGKPAGPYRRFCNPLGDEYAEFLRRHGNFYSIGENYSILISTNFSDPPYVSIRNNVQFSTRHLIGHDGSINMLNIAYDVKLDSVGKIDIRDNFFIGFNPIILPGVTIGPNEIVAAGAVVSKDVAPGDIVGGVPAKPIGRVDELVGRLQEKTNNLPWTDLIANRVGGYDPAIDPELLRQRIHYFYPTEPRESQ